MLFEPLGNRGETFSAAPRQLCGVGYPSRILAHFSMSAGCFALLRQSRYFCERLLLAPEPDPPPVPRSVPPAPEPPPDDEPPEEPLPDEPPDDDPLPEEPLPP